MKTAFNDRKLIKYFHGCFDTCLLAGMCLVLLLGLSGCGRNKNWIFSIRDNLLFEKDVMIYGLIYAKEYNVRDKELLNEEYEENITYGQYYKKQLEQDIIDTLLLYEEAKNAGFELGDDGKEGVDTKTEQFWAYYGDRLSDIDIEHEDVKRVYEMKAVAQGYVEGLTGDLGVDSNEATGVRYIKVYQVTFPTVQLDENGMVVSGKDGRLVHISDEEMQKKREEAQQLSEDAKAGGSLETLVKKYDNTVTGMEKYLPYDGLDRNYKNAVDGLNEGGISSVIASDYGYYVINLLDKDASEYSKDLLNHESGKQNDNQKQEMLNDLYDKYIYGRNEYKSQGRWDSLSFDIFIK